MHGGGYLEWFGTRYDSDYLATKLASKGYSVFNIEYLRYFLPFDIRGAMWRATQYQAAFIKHLSTHHKEFGVDKDRIVLVGQSAGAISSLLNVLMDENDYVESEIYQILDELYGCLDCNSPYDEVEIKDVVKGVVSIAGGITDYKLLDPENLENTQFLFVHGNEDFIVPYDGGLPLQEVGQAYNDVFEILGKEITRGLRELDREIFDNRFRDEIELWAEYLKLFSFEDAQHMHRAINEKGGNSLLMELQGEGHFLMNAALNQVPKRYTGEIVDEIDQFVEMAAGKQKLAAKFKDVSTPKKVLIVSGASLCLFFVARMFL